MAQECKTENCEVAAIARGLCMRHYQQWRRSTIADAEVKGLRDLTKPDTPSKIESHGEQRHPEPEAHRENPFD